MLAFFLKKEVYFFEFYKKKCKIENEIIITTPSWSGNFERDFFRFNSKKIKIKNRNTFLSNFWWYLNKKTPHAIGYTRDFLALNEKNDETQINKSQLLNIY